MKRFAILRDLDPAFTWDEMDVAAIQTIVNTGQGEADLDVAWEPRIMGASWIRTLWAPGTSWGLCLYGGKDREAVERYNVLCGLPYERIDEVEDVESPVAREGYPRGRRVEAHDVPLLAIEGPASALPPSGLDQPTAPASGWIRTYCPAEMETALAVFKKDSIPAELIKRYEDEGCEIRRIVEVAPADYLGWD